jgi:hypothetical protein
VHRHKTAGTATRAPAAGERGAGERGAGELRPPLALFCPTWPDRELFYIYYEGGVSRLARTMGSDGRSCLQRKGSRAAKPGKPGTGAAKPGRLSRCRAAASAFSALCRHLC